MEITHPVVIVGSILGAACILLALFGKVGVPIFGRIFLENRRGRVVLGVLGASILLCSSGLTFSPSWFTWILMGQTEEACNRVGDRVGSVAAKSEVNCKRACAEELACNAWTYQPGHRSTEHVDCFLYREVTQKEFNLNTSSGLRRPFARNARCTGS